MRYVIKIQMDNAAFSLGLRDQEIYDILRDLNESRDATIYEGPIRDHNGNTVGSAKVTRT